MNKLTLALGLGAALLSGACSNNDEHVAKLRAAVDKADITLKDAVAIAEADTQAGAAQQAALLVNGEPVFMVRAPISVTPKAFDIELNGQLRSAQNISAQSAECADSISLTDALTVAEVEAGGEAVAVVPDDDVACAFEIQVLTPATLWEVKVSKAGDVLESEESDEDGSGD